MFRHPIYLNEFPPQFILNSRDECRWWCRTGDDNTYILAYYRMMRFMVLQKGIQNGRGHMKDGYGKSCSALKMDSGDDFLEQICVAPLAV